MPNETISVGSLSVELIRKSEIKNLYIRVYPPDGNVIVTAPESLAKESIELYILKRFSDIIKVVNRMKQQERQSQREYVSGESHYLWGKLYRLQVVYEGAHSKIVKTPNKIVMTVPEGTGLEARKRVLTEWYRQELKRVLDIIVPMCEKKTGISVKEFCIKNMKTRWGTCNINKRRIWINLQLVKKPMDCLEYIVIHELVHFLEKNHTYRFHALVEQFFPTWKESKKLLNSLPLDYFENEDFDHDI